MVKDIQPSGVYGGPAHLTAVGDTLFMAADDGRHGIELWKSDGTESGTVMVKDIGPGKQGFDYEYYYGPEELAARGGTLFFTAFDRAHGRSVWRSDGTEAGTVIVKQDRAGKRYKWDARTFDNLAVAGEQVFFDSGGGGLWRSDGTEAGTLRLEEVSAPTLDPSFAAMGETMFFTADDPAHGEELWKLEGGQGEAVMVKDIQPGSSGYGPEYSTVVGDRVFFHADDGVHGGELWSSDGTEAGTVMVKDIRPGARGPGLTGLTDVDDRLFFVAADRRHGQELWTSDGTEAGTVMVKDIRPGVPGGRPAQLTAVDGRSFFTADDGTCGRELWDVGRHSGRHPPGQGPQHHETQAAGRPPRWWGLMISSYSEPPALRPGDACRRRLRCPARPRSRRPAPRGD